MNRRSAFYQKVAREFAEQALLEDFTYAFELRQTSSYEVGSEPAEAAVQQLLLKAEAFVA